MTLREKLLELKGDKSYQQLADELGISKSHVYPCLVKGRPMGIKFLRAVLTKWPGLEDLVLEYIKGKSNGSGNMAPKDA